MRLLILGANGQLGHRLWIAARERHEVWVTLRGGLAGKPWRELFDPRRTIEHVAAAEPGSIDRALAVARPEVVINASGLVKQRVGGDDIGSLFAANCFLPHLVRRRCDALGARLITVSTDCVFTGTVGGYRESDEPDAQDGYGLSKLLGEVTAPHLTLRTSHIGRSLEGTHGLLEWFLAQPGPVDGYSRAVFSGPTAPALADTILEVIDGHPALAGLWHVAADPIDKLDLLTRVRSAFGLSTDIIARDEPVIDRSLDDSRFRAATHIPRPNWDAMLEQIASDPIPYASLRGN